MAKRIFGIKAKSKKFKQAFSEAFQDAEERLAVVAHPEDGDADAMGTWEDDGTRRPVLMDRYTGSVLDIAGQSPTRRHTGRKLT